MFPKSGTCCCVSHVFRATIKPMPQTHDIHPHAELIARTIHRRRRDEGLSRLAVERRGGPYRQTQEIWENGRVSRKINEDTYDKWDIGLGWPSGTTRALTQGIVPGEVVPEKAEEEGTTTVAKPELRAVLGAITNLRRQAAQIEGVPSALQKLLDELTAAQADLMLGMLDQSPPGNEDEEPPGTPESAHQQPGVPSRRR